jgi:hypothetical protein
VGRDIAAALNGLEQALAPVVAACRRWDAYIEEATHQLQTAARASEPLRTAPVQPPVRGGVSESPFVGTNDAAPVVTPVQPASGRPRVDFPRYGTPRVDNLVLTSCRGPGQLAAVLLPAIRALGASEGLIEGLKLLAARAPPLPGA